jgi:HEAT repeat protein
MQRMAAETVARAHPLGVPGLNDAVPRLETLLTEEASHPSVRFAAARALIVLDSRDSSAKLFDASQARGADLRQLVEPALAQWDYAPALDVWIARLDATDVRHRDLLLAVRGLGEVGDSSALSQLLSIAIDLTRESDLRLEAATAAGLVADSGLETDADRLAHERRTPPIVNQLCAVRMLARHASDRSNQLLAELAGGAEPAVVVAALRRLYEVDPALVVPLAEAAMQSTDPLVRLEGARAWLTLPTVERISTLGRLLADAHPDVRREVCERLLALAETPEFDEPIRAAAMDVLAGERWQGQEQAALLLGTLEDKAATTRLVELLDSPRQEVQLATAWALRSIADPESILALTTYARRKTELRKEVDVPGLDDQVAHVFEALGVLQAQEAVPLLVEYIPKNRPTGMRSRGAAIWALGRIKAGTRDADLEQALIERVTDFPERNPEIDLVKQMSAVALARMNAVDEAATMRDVIETQVISLPLGVTLRWAVEQLTDEEIPPPIPPPASQPDWFLEPVP